jgi:hypothetical protein
MEAKEDIHHKARPRRDPAETEIVLMEWNHEQVCDGKLESMCVVFLT